jgi:hypothetical protein
MEDKPVTVVISDLHVGGGPSDKGDDHVYQNSQFVRFLRQLEESERAASGRSGGVELFINGDFLEFAQVKPRAYAIRSSRYWCSEKESLQKLEAIIKGHCNIFEALEQFQRGGNGGLCSNGAKTWDVYLT